MLAFNNNNGAHSNRVSVEVRQQIYFLAQNCINRLKLGFNLLLAIVTFGSRKRRKKTLQFYFFVLYVWKATTRSKDYGFRVAQSAANEIDGNVSQERRAKKKIERGRQVWGCTFRATKFCHFSPKVLLRNLSSVVLSAPSIGAFIAVAMKMYL